MQKNKGIILLIVLLFIFFVNFVSAQEENISESASLLPYVDPLVLEEFNRRDEVPIMVDVRDTSGIYIVQTDTKEEQHFKDLKKQEFLENKTKFVLSTLSNEEFKLKKILLSGKGFVGNITLVGFKKLANNSNIEFIYLDKPLYLAVEPRQKIEEGGVVQLQNDSPNQNFSVLQKEQKLSIKKDDKQVSWGLKIIHFLKLLFWF